MRPTTTPLENPRMFKGRRLLAEEMDSSPWLDMPPGARKEDAAFSTDLTADIRGPKSWLIRRPRGSHWEVEATGLISSKSVFF
ncbi:hypothetical protein IMZ48_36575 [Candidatus Bathyarchaeota archaeon]|nr:hypothetical protein [Candidatus Bathyarchaeota archaeon]